MWGVAHSALTSERGEFTISLHACGLVGRPSPHPQVGDSCLGYLAGLWRLGSHDCFLSPQLYLVSISSVLHEDAEEDSGG